MVNESSTAALRNLVTSVQSSTAIKHYMVQIVPVHLKDGDAQEGDSVVNEYSVVQRDISVSQVYCCLMFS